MRLPAFRDLVERFPALRLAAGRGRRRAIPFVQQLSATECGAACLAMVLRYYGRAVPVDELRELAVSGRDATNAQVLIETGARYGLRGRAVSLDLDQLEYLERGAILHWEFTHFVVLDRVTTRGIYVVDPARGRRFVTADQVRTSFTGVAVLFDPDETFQRGGSRRSSVAGYLRAVASERGFLSHIVVTSLLIQIFGLAVPFLTRVLIDRVIPLQDHSLLFLIAAGMVVLIVFQALTAIIRALLLIYLRARLDSRMTVAFVDHLMRLPFSFFQRRATGDLLVRVNSNATVREILTGTVLSTMLDGTLAFGYLAILLMVSWPVAVLAMTLASVQIVLFLVTRRRQRQLVAEELEVQGRSNGHLIEMLSSVESLKGLGAESRAVERWTSLFSSELNVVLRRGRLDALIEASTSALRMASSMALLGVGAYQVMGGALTLGDMLAVTAVATGFMTPLISMASAASRLQLLMIYLERLNDVLDTPSEQDRQGRRQLRTFDGSLRADRVSFRYGPVSPFVLRSISFEVRPGEFLAIVGRSGSGKSTMARILATLYEPSEGSVAYDGYELAELDLGTLRPQIAVVTQQAQLLAGTIRSNISLAVPGCDLSLVIKAAQMAHIHTDILAMPMAYDTPVFDRGSSLSGGQQQRLALARALLIEPKVLILDEATSQMDAATERIVQANLQTLACTRIVIAHRLSTVRHADRIVVLEAGQLVEQGSHDALMAHGGVYASLIAAQTGDAAARVTTIG